MAHIYINECIGDDRETYLIHHGQEVGFQDIVLGINNSFSGAWEHNPKMQGKIEKPTLYDITVGQIKQWLTACENGNIRIQPVHRIEKENGETFVWYLSYAPDMPNKPLTDKQKDLQKRISHLCEMSNEIYEISETRECYLNIPEAYADKDALLAAREEAYQMLFSETVRIYA